MSTTITEGTHVHVALRPACEGAGRPHSPHEDEMHGRVTGIDPVKISIAMQAYYFERPMRSHAGLIDNAGALVADPVKVFEGTMDTMPINLGEYATVSMTCENRLADWKRPSQRRWTDAEQQHRFPGDVGFDYVARLVDKEIWRPALDQNEND